MLAIQETDPRDRDKEERKLQKVKIALMRNPTFALWSGILMCGTTSVRDDMPTAATDGYNEFYGRAFIKKLDEKMLAFVVLHENLHKAFRHLSTWKKLFDEAPRLANQACDYVINLIIVDQDPTGKFVTFPVIDGQKVGLLDVRFKGMNSKQVFDILKQEKKNRKKQKGSGGGGQGQGEPGDGDPDDGDDDGEGSGGFDEHLWGDAKAVSKEVQDARIQELDQAIRQGQAMHQKMHGNGSAGMGRELGDILDPQADWKELLREFVQANCAAKDTSSWRRVNRRFISQDLLMPSLIGETVRELVIGIDASGSTWSGNVLNRFLGEVKFIAEGIRPEHLTVLYWDGAVCGVENYDLSTLDTLIANTKIKGGGGTDPMCVSNYLKKEGIKPECVVMLTDGYVPNWGEWSAPVLWVVAGNDGATSSTGKTIHISDD